MPRVTLGQVIMRLEQVAYHRAHDIKDDEAQARELEWAANELYRIAGKVRRGETD